ncbi:Defective in cullin neddylation protein [Plasmodiophora brassicae]
MGGRLPGLGAGPIRGGQTGICQSPGLQTSSSAMSTQKAKIKEFRGVTHASDKDARAYLKKCNWDLSVAINEFYQGNQGRGQSSTNSAALAPTLSPLFDQYEDPNDKNLCVADYLVIFLNDIGCDPEGVNALALMWALNASKMGIITREEFVNGFSALGCTTLADMKNAANKTVPSMLANEQEFREFYKWLFDYMKEDEKKRTISKDLALAVWGIVFNESMMPLVKPLSTFIAESETDAFSKDMWMQSYEFMRDTAADLSNFDPAGAWPSLIDEFVESRKGRQ